MLKVSPPLCYLPTIGGTHLPIGTCDQKPLLRRTDASGPCACRRQKFTEKCGSPNPRRAERGTTPSIDEAGLPTGFTPPCWRITIAVVDSDPRIRRTQALLNLSETREAPHGMLAPTVTVEGCARYAHGMTGKRTNVAQFCEKPEEKLSAFPSFSFKPSDSTLGHTSRDLHDILVCQKNHTSQSAFLQNHCDNFRKQLPEWRHWHVPNLYNGALSHTLFCLHLKSPQFIPESAPQSEPLEFSHTITSSLSLLQRSALDGLSCTDV